MSKLSKEQIVAIGVLHDRGGTNSATARLLGVTEGAVRHQLKRRGTGKVDGRRKEFMVERLGLGAVVWEWWNGQVELLDGDRSPNVEELYFWLRGEHGYEHSYKSVLRYVRARFPGRKLRPFRRVETPPGAQSQSDWFEEYVDAGRGPEKLYGFLMTLSHSRHDVVVWSRSKNQLAWLHCHNEAYCRQEGIAAVNRIDNEKTAISKGSGAWGEINQCYRAYARGMGFHVEACAPRSPQQKGKVERGVSRVRKVLRLAGRVFASLEELQEYTDLRLEADSRRRVCPATGLSVGESWEAEKKLLRSLPPNLPAPFDLIKTCRVFPDCTVHFEGRSYVVPFGYVDEQVEVRGCSGTVEIADCRSSLILVSYPRGTGRRILIDQRCYQGEATERVAAPVPMGALSTRIQELAEAPVQYRAVDFYEALAEVAR